MPTVTPRIPAVLDHLRQRHPDARYELNWSTPLEMLVATILAAQCTDERVNRVTATLFQTYQSARDYADADPAALEEAIKSTGFYRNKAKAIQGACRALCDRFGGEVPRTMEDMLTLPGVARKTANVVLTTAYGIASGVIVDTHVARVSRRMGLSRETDPDRIEQDLMRLVHQRDWTFFGPAMVLHGRYTCTARSPACGACGLTDQCPKHLEPGVVPGPGGGGEGEADEATAKKAQAGKKGHAAKAAGAPAARAVGATAKKAAIETTERTMAKTREAKTTAAKNGAGKGGAGKGGAADAGPLFRREAKDAAEGSEGLPPIPDGWRAVLADEVHKPYYAELSRFVSEEREKGDVFPPRDEVFNALALTPYDQVKVVLLGQDPYHDHGQAQGLCFSVRPPVPPPPSLLNMFKELQTDVGFRIPNNGSLVPWAKQGVLLLNAVLTVRAHTPNSHKNQGWETFTDAVLHELSERKEPVVFVLWGAYAQKKAKLIDTSRHPVLMAAHPSPLSARNGFFGSKPFSAINDALKRLGEAPIDWQLPDV